MIRKLRRVGEPKRHDEIFEVAISGAECCLPFITFTYSAVMYSVLNTQYDPILKKSVLSIEKIQYEKLLRKY